MKRVAPSSKENVDTCGDCGCSEFGILMFTLEN